MCSTCGSDREHLEPWTPDMDRALRMICLLYATRDGIVGGPLHVQLEDFNIWDDCAYNWRPVDYGDILEWEPETIALCDDLLPLLMSIPEPSRVTVLVFFHRLHYPRRPR